MERGGDDSKTEIAEKQPLLPVSTDTNTNDKVDYKTIDRSGNSSTALALSTTIIDESAAVDEDDEDELKKNDNNLVVYFLLMLAFALGNRIFGRLQVYPMHNYPLFVSNLSVVIYIPICFAYIIPIISYTNIITKEQTEIPKYKFAVMGYYDSIAGIMQTFAVNYISSASTVVLVQQSAIPISMIVSSLTLNSKYSMSQYIGATIVMSGIIFVLIPNFVSSGNKLGPSASSSLSSMSSAVLSLSTTTDSIDTDSMSMYSSGGGANTSTESSNELLWVAILVISCIPMCLSSVYKEKALGETEIDCTYLNGWVAVFQFLIAIPLMIPSATVQGIPMSNIIPNLYGGMLCWFGVNTITEDYNPYNQPLDDCTNAPLFVNLYLVFNVLYNFLIVVILKYGSANILWLASTVIVPLSNVVFSLKFVPNSKPMGLMDVVGLVVIMMGLIIYRFNSQLREIYEYIIGTKVGEEELLNRKNAQLMSSKLTRKQLPFIGINQIESLQTLVDTRIMKDQIKKLLHRSPRVIRENYMMKLGVIRSPQTSYSAARLTQQQLQNPQLSQQQQKQQQQQQQREPSPAASLSPTSSSMNGVATSKQPAFLAPRRNLSLAEGKPKNNTAVISGNTSNFIEHINKKNEGNGKNKDIDFV